MEPVARTHRESEGNTQAASSLHWARAEVVPARSPVRFQARIASGLEARVKSKEAGSSSGVWAPPGFLTPVVCDAPESLRVPSAHPLTMPELLVRMQTLSSTASEDPTPGCLRSCLLTVSREIVPAGNSTQYSVITKAGENLKKE